MLKRLPLSLFMLALCSLAYTLFPCHAVGQASGSIVGQVFIAPGRELTTPVLITVTSHGAIIYRNYTDSEGHYGVNGLPASTFHVTINDEAYQPVDQEARIDSVTSASMVILNIYLIPRNPDKTQAATKGGNVHLVDSAKLNEQIPKPARKEYDRGVKADGVGKADEAIRHYEKALKIAPDFYPACNNLGTSYLNKGLYAAAEGQFQHAIRLNANDAAAYFNLGNLYYLTHHNDEALNWVNQGLSKEPSSSFGHFLKGSLALAAGDNQLAEKELQRSLELDPKLSKAHLALVNLFIRQKRNPEAADELRSFLKISPDDAMAPKAREVLKRLEDSSRKN